MNVVGWLSLFVMYIITLLTMTASVLLLVGLFALGMYVLVRYVVLKNEFDKLNEQKEGRLNDCQSIE